MNETRALHGFSASKGVFITTGRFSQGAKEYAASVGTRTILIDGTRIVSLMIKYRVGVQVKRSYDVVELDEDFFESTECLSSNLLSPYGNKS
ncbi:restriction endonuclease [Paenarthrobacter sp. NPDC089322]|uniref:restriction endonuclease n=1 Tax=Paenarthrobacter sp. NPDC089322 TaxID=3155065 RepID=UPI003429BAEC